MAFAEQRHVKVSPLFNTSCFFSAPRHDAICGVVQHRSLSKTTFYHCMHFSKKHDFFSPIKKKAWTIKNYTIKQFLKICILLS